MTTTIMILPSIKSYASISASMAFINQAQKLGKTVAFLQPIENLDSDSKKKLLQKINITPHIAIPRQKAIDYLANNEQDILIDKLIKMHHDIAKNADLVIVEPCDSGLPLATVENALDITIAKNLNATIIPFFNDCCALNEEKILEKTILSKKLFNCNQLIMRTILINTDIDSNSTLKQKLKQNDIHLLGSLPSADCHDQNAIMHAANTSLDLQNLDPKIFERSSTINTPNQFMHALKQKAAQNKQTIVLPESEVDRILIAANRLAADNLVNIVLLGNPETVRANAQKLSIDLHPDIQIIDHLTHKNFSDYVSTLFELRKEKGLSLEQAQKLMKDRTYYATMMVYKNHVHGMVSGATTTTAETIRPALQFIKTKPGIKSVSGSFLICLQDQTLIYADCAVIPNPSPRQIAETAISSAETATAFNIDPKIALLSYSTGKSGSGPDVDKVREAADILAELAPNLQFEGPIQYDAAVNPDVAKTKLPNSKVAGHANTFIFPSLEAGNIGYKAVQRSAHAIAIGPILQGLNKPVNDLSRGATVTDILNTVIITAIQAQQ